MRTLLATLTLLFSIALPCAAQTPVDILIAISKSKDKPVTPPAPKPIAWESYAAAYAKHKADGLPLVVLATMPGCAPCQKVKKELETAAVQGAAYCYLDVTVEVDIAGKLAIGSSVPVLMTYQAFGAVGSRFSGEQLHAGVAASAVRSLIKPSK